MVFGDIPSSHIPLPFSDNLPQAGNATPPQTTHNTPRTPDPGLGVSQSSSVVIKGWSQLCYSAVSKGADWIYAAKSVEKNIDRILNDYFVASPSSRGSGMALEKACGHTSRRVDDFQARQTESLWLCRHKA